jgi:hypothetical protein
MTSTYASNFGTIQSSQNATLSKVKLIAHHQFPGVELVSPVYVGDGIACYLSPDQRVDVGSTMQAGFNIDLEQEKPIGALMYKLQRKNTNQTNEETTCIQFVVTWKVYRSGEFCVAPRLIEHDNGHVWDIASLNKLAEGCDGFNIQHGLIEHTRLTHDDIVLMTSMNVTREEECYILEITISKASTNDTQRLQYTSLDK